MTDELKQKIEDQIKSNAIFLYMKGTPDFPQCGFSATAVDILDQYKVKFETFNIFDDQDIREGIKEYSDWPTIPQLYANGEFVGGCDILIELHNSGELTKVLEKKS